jgi:hypothetical protein
MALALAHRSMVAVPASLRVRQSAGFCDALGERFVAPDPVTGRVVQSLNLADAITDVPAFEFALRQRVAHLSDFSHSSYLRVCRIDRTRPDGSGLVVVSEHAEGLRLSEVLYVAEARRAHLDISTALAVVRQLLAAVADAQEQAPDVANGLITPERIIMTPDARVLLAEQALCAAIEQLQYDPDRLWQELRIGVEPGSSGTHFTHRTDVLNIGLVALALVLRRGLREEDFPFNLARWLEAAREHSTLGYERPVSGPLRNWLGRALQLDGPSSFATAVQARASFEQIVAADPLYLSSPLALEVLHEECAANLDAVAHFDRLPSGNASGSLRSATLKAGPDGASTALSPSAALRFLSDREIVAEMLPPSPVISEAGGWIAPSEAVVVPAVEDRLEAGTTSRGRLFAAESPFEAEGPADVRAALLTAKQRRLAVAAVVVGLLAGGVAVARSFGPSVAAASESGTLAVDTRPAGMQVFVDGTERGRTPLRLAVPPGEHLLDVRANGGSRRVPFTVAGGAEFSQYLEFGDRAETASHQVPTAAMPAPSILPSQLGAAATPSAAKPAWGWLVVKSSTALDVRLDGKVIGSTASPRIRMAAGEHEVELVSDAQAYRTFRVVSITPAKPTHLAVSIPASGVLNVNASPWAEVWIGRRRIGETPLANVAVPVGRHEIVFRHPQLGEKRQSISVTAGPPLRLSMNMR